MIEYGAIGWYIIYFSRCFIVSPHAEQGIPCPQLTWERKIEPVEVCVLRALAVVLSQPMDVLMEVHRQFDSRPGILK
jgi:hypothetical protein